jgi:hypothetical protein
VKTTSIVLFVLLALTGCGDEDGPPPAPGTEPDPSASWPHVRTEGASPRTPTARDVLDLVAKTYAGCKSYRDSGVVRTVFVRGKGRRTVEKPFRTAFVRPDRFRFQYELDGDVYIVWRGGDEVLSWWYVEPGVEKVSSLGLALAGATGVSGGSAHTVPALLLPSDVSGRRVTELAEAMRIDDARIDEVDCFRIAGTSSGSPHILWIDQKTYLVRRIEEGHRFDKFRTEETTNYDPALDGEVPDESLRFDPPKEK